MFVSQLATHRIYFSLVSLVTAAPEHKDEANGQSLLGLHHTDDVILLIGFEGKQCCFYMLFLDLSSELETFKRRVSIQCFSQRSWATVPETMAQNNYTSVLIQYTMYTSEQ